MTVLELIHWICVVLAPMPLSISMIEMIEPTRIALTSTLQFIHRIDQVFEFFSKNRQTNFKKEISKKKKKLSFFGKYHF